MSAGDRRAQVVEAATRAFAQGGYHGTTTDVVARTAGVSQPYVVRIFGTKLALFLEVFDQAVERIRVTFSTVIAAAPSDPSSEEGRRRLSLAYNNLLDDDRDLLQVIMHGFSTGAVNEIAAHSRAGMAAIFDTVRATGWDDDTVRDFVAHGMLINVLLSMRAPENAAESVALVALTTATMSNPSTPLAGPT